MLTSTKVLRYIEKNLGYKFTELELDPDEIMDDLKMFSIKTYSKYFPYVISINQSNLTLTDNRLNKFVMNPGNDIEILSVNRVVTGNMDYSDPSIMLRGGSSQGDAFSSVLANDMASMVANPITFRFYPPDVIEIYPAIIGLTQLTVFINCVHPGHFATIPTNMEEQFLKFALLEAKVSLYQLRHRFSNLETPYGNIELFIEDLQEAEGKRDELIEYWRKMSPRQANRKRLYIY